MKFTDDSVQTFLRGGSEFTLAKLSELLPDVSYSEIFDAAERLHPRSITIGDKYWLQLHQGFTLEDISRFQGTKRSTIVSTIKNAGYSLDLLVPVGEYGFVMYAPRHLQQAWELLGNRSLFWFRQKLKEVEKQVEQGRILDRSQLKGEDRIVFQMDLAPEDLDRVDILLKKSTSEWSSSPPKRGRSKIIRLLLEEMIESMPELNSVKQKLERKKMLKIGRTPRIAANALGAKPWRTSFYTPTYVHVSAILPNQGDRGSGQLSNFFREAIDEIIDNPELVDALPPILSFRMPQGFRRKYPHPKGSYSFSERVSLVLLHRQRAPVENLKQRYGSQHNLSPEQQYTGLLGALALWKTGTSQAQLPGYVDWVEFVHKYKRNSNPEWVKGILSRLEGTVFMRVDKG